MKCEGNAWKNPNAEKVENGGDKMLWISIWPEMQRLSILLLTLLYALELWGEIHRPCEKAPALISEPGFRGGKISVP
jgi:hypothetical protein